VVASGRSEPLRESVNVRCMGRCVFVGVIIDVRRWPASSSLGCFASGDLVTLVRDHSPDSSSRQRVTGLGVRVGTAGQHLRRSATKVSPVVAARDPDLVLHRQGLRFVTALTCCDEHAQGRPCWSTFGCAVVVHPLRE